MPSGVFFVLTFEAIAQPAEMAEHSKVLLLDGFNLAFRAFHAMPELTDDNGFPTGALHGWIKTLWKLDDMETPSRMIVFFDQGGSQRHLELLPDYKANRDEMPEALVLQLPIIRELTALCGCTIIAKEGVEADDLLGAVAVHLAEAGEDVVVVSADKDLAQLVRPEIAQLLPAPTANPRIGWRKLDVSGVEAKFGVPPERIPDYLALIGDNSDNIPGLKGVGPKTAVKWILEHGGIDAIIAAAEELEPKRFRSMVAESVELLKTNLELVTLSMEHRPAVPEQSRPNAAALVRVLERYGMKQAAKQAWDRYGLGL